VPYLRTAIGHPLEKAFSPLLSVESDSSTLYDPDIISPRPSIPIQAKTLGEAVIAAEEYFGIRIAPHDPPKWFRLYFPDRPEGNFALADIHIIREGKDICPKQDLSFPLLESDTVYIGALAC
jgi:hypothetical protein